MRRNLVVPDLDAIEKRIDREQRVRDLAALIRELDVTAILCGGDERRQHHAVPKIAKLERAALQLLEGCGAQALQRELPPVGIRRKLPADLEQRVRHDLLDDPCIRRPVSALPDALLERALADHALEHLCTELAPDVLVELDAIQIKELGLLGLVIALELL